MAPPERVPIGPAGVMPLPGFEREERRVQRRGWLDERV